jgi:hypothetical protein
VVYCSQMVNWLYLSIALGSRNKDLEQYLKYVQYKRVRTMIIQQTVILSHLINITLCLYSHNFLSVEFSYCNYITGWWNFNSVLLSFQFHCHV